ncbi:MAG: hypothetical protein AAGG44_00630 [Planctomycetota bacterium]
MLTGHDEIIPQRNQQNGCLLVTLASTTMDSDASTRSRCALPLQAVTGYSLRMHPLLLERLNIETYRKIDPSKPSNPKPDDQRRYQPRRTT